MIKDDQEMMQAVSQFISALATAAVAGITLYTLTKSKKALVSPKKKEVGSIAPVPAAELWGDEDATDELEM